MILWLMANMLWSRRSGRVVNVGMQHLVDVIPCLDPFSGLMTPN